MADRKWESKRLQIPGSPAAERYHKEAFYMGAAADLLEAGESCTEFRVAYLNVYTLCSTADRALREAAEIRKSGIVATAQRCEATTTRTPWTDLEEAEDRG